jgi:hypothetical protein
MAVKPGGLSGYSQRVVTINDFGLQERTRTSKAGKESVRFTVAISGTPLPHDLNPRELGRGPALAMADWLRNRVKTIQAVAAPRTIKRREYAAKAFKAGEDWAMARYAGGRMGQMAPNALGVRMFNDSGRFAAGITALPQGARGAPSAGEWTINVPANRWDPDTLSGPEGFNSRAALDNIFAALVELVPEFGDPAMLVNIPSVRRAIVSAAGDIVRKSGDLRDRLQAARMKALRTALDTFGSALSGGIPAGNGIGGLFTG